MTNVHDIARRAGVSPITVSRVVNNHPNVAAATRQRVLDAVAELNYVPNAVARALKQSKSGLLALLITDIMSPFFTAVARGAEDAARAAGFSLMLGNSDEDPAIELEYLRVMGERRVDGLVLVPTSQAGSALKSQFPWHLPVVLLDRELADTEMSSVRCDSQAGTVLLCQHLIRLGHRRIAIVGGLPGVSTWEERVAGYRAALDGAHIPIVPELIIPGTYRGESGAGAVRRLCSGDGLPDVIVAANAQVAVGVLDTLVSAGYRVPDDVGVAAIDDPLPGSSFWPRLTVVEQPGYAMGHAAVELLIERLGQPKEQWESRHIVFPASLKLGTSCGEPFHDVHQARQTTP